MFPKLLKNKYLLVAVLIVVLLAGGATWYYGFAPALSVNGKNISMGEFLQIQSAISQFDKLSHKNSTSTPDIEIKKQAFGNIIDRMLLDKIVSELDSSMNQKARDNVKETVSKNQDFSLGEASRKLYGLSEEDFIEFVLVPQAKRNLIAQHFSNDAIKVNEVWDNAVKNANIKIYYPGFYWENGEVKSK